MLEALLAIPTTTAPPVDNTVLLMHFNGTDGSQSFVEEKGLSITRTGMCRHSSTQSKFGGTSLYIDGSLSYLSFPQITLTGDFTIEFWFYQISNSGAYCPIVSGTVGTYNFPVILNYPNSSATGYMGAYLQSGAGSTYVGPVFSLNTWTHMVMMRKDNALHGFANGERVFASSPGAIPVYLDTIGGYYGGAGFCLNGYMDELRISKTAVYPVSNNIPVPTAPYSS